jgi:alginate O-acetyltransferase complex protein AlgI
MFFNSYLFILCFAPLSIVAFHACRGYLGERVAVWCLILFSALFYSTWDPQSLKILIFSVLLNYSIVLVAATAPRPRMIVAAGIVCNLLLLGYFKYSLFAASIVGPWLPAYEGPLPLGISFFTIQQIVFLVSFARLGAVRPAFSPYAAAVGFYPHVVAGPIVPYSSLMSQFGAGGRDVQIERGLTLFAIGLAKKILLADPLAEPVAAIFGHAGTLSAADAWCGALAYALQLYFDFSGYTDMALGLAHLFGVRLPVNFNSPYKADSIRDFWHRWHMTLSGVLRDLLYIPLGGNRLGRARTVLNLMLTMLIGGLWHGAGWTFIFWGALHGLYLVGQHVYDWLNGPALPRRLAWALTFVLVVIAWVPFRAPDLATTFEFLAAMVGKNGATPALANSVLALQLISGLGIVWLAPNSLELVNRDGPKPRWLASPVGVAACAVLMVGSLAGLGQISTFIYFSF